MDKVCGPARVRLDVGPVPGKTTLLFAQPDGTSRLAEAPAGLSDYSPIGLACVTSRDGDAYAVVQYGEVGQGCGFCEWFALYDAAGNALTRNDPAILENPDMPPAQRQSPNNAEYEAVIGRLGITHPEVDVIQ